MLRRASTGARCEVGNEASPVEERRQVNPDYNRVQANVPAACHDFLDTNQ